MLQLGSDLDSAGTLLELCWKAAAAAAAGIGGNHGLAVDRKDLVGPSWMNSETMRKKPATRAIANFGYLES